MRPSAVMGMPRVGVDFPRDVVFGECRDCKAELGWSAACPRDLPKLCVACVSLHAQQRPAMCVLLPSGQRSVLATQVASGTVH
jgi:hypothetical protein